MGLSLPSCLVPLPVTAPPSGLLEDGHSHSTSQPDPVPPMPSAHPWPLNSLLEDWVSSH